MTKIQPFLSVPQAEKLNYNLRKINKFADKYPYEMRIKSQAYNYWYEKADEVIREILAKERQFSCG